MKRSLVFVPAEVVSGNDVEMIQCREPPEAPAENSDIAVRGFGFAGAAGRVDFAGETDDRSSRNGTVDSLPPGLARSSRSWGIRFGAGGVTYSVSGDRGVRIELGSRDSVMVGSQHADELADAIAQRIGGLGDPRSGMRTRSSLEVRV